VGELSLAEDYDLVAGIVRGREDALASLYDRYHRQCFAFALRILSVEGELVLAEASPARFQELGRAQITGDTTRALPALAGGKLYLRTNDTRGGKLLCVEVGGKE